MKLTTFFTFPILLLLLLVFVSCSSAPSDDNIKMAITEALEENVPVSWSGSLLGGKNAKIELIEIIDIGKQSEKGKYWPVKARVKGNCEARMFTGTELKQFDKTATFRIYQDEFENWKAYLNQFQ